MMDVRDSPTIFSCIHLSEDVRDTCLVPNSTAGIMTAHPDTYIRLMGKMRIFILSIRTVVSRSMAIVKTREMMAIRILSLAERIDVAVLSRIRGVR